MNSHGYDILLFDVDDTLFDFHRAEEESFYETMSSFGVQAGERMLKLYSGINAGLWQALQNGELTQEELVVRRFEMFFSSEGIQLNPHEVNDRFLETLGQKAILFPDTYEVCKSLSTEYRLFMITNSVAFVHRSRVKSCPITPFFEDMFVSGEVGCVKPSRGFFDGVARRIPGFDKSRALVIGDSPTSDIAGAVEYGIDACLIKRRRQEGENTGGAAARYEISDLYGLYDILNNKIERKTNQCI